MSLSGGILNGLSLGTFSCCLPAALNADLAEGGNVTWPVRRDIFS